MPAPNAKPPVVVRVPAPRRDVATRIAVVAAVFLAIAIIKPWPSSVREVASGPVSPSASAAPGPTQTISPVLGYCHDPVGWRVASVEDFLDGTAVRGWGAIEPIAATGPRDARIPSFVVSGGAVSAIGYCAPLYDVPPADAKVTIFRLDGSRAPQPITIVRLGPNPPSPLGALYRPPPDAQEPAPTAPASWATGIYIFRVSTATGYERWFGADVRIF